MTNPRITSFDKRTVIESIFDDPRSVIRVGNLTWNPELQHAKQDGKPFVRFGLACSSPAVPGDWNGEQRRDLYEVVAFGSLAENCVASLTKGCRVIVVGRPQEDRWTNRQGEERVTIRIVANAVGPDLRWAIATIEKAAPGKPAEQAFDGLAGGEE